MCVVCFSVTVAREAHVGLVSQEAAEAEAFGQSADGSQLAETCG